jgi:diguanylate cyclase (GGDEF)-like protein
LPDHRSELTRRGRRHPAAGCDFSDLLRCMPRLLSILLIVSLAAVCRLGASEPSQSPALPTLVTALQVHSLASKEAARGYPVHLKGVVTFYDSSLNHHGYCPTFVHDDTGDIYVKVVFGMDKDLQVGSVIDLHGVSEAGEFAPVIAGARIKVTGHSGVPLASAHPTLARLLSGSEDGKWIVEEGVIHSVVETDHHVNLQLWMDDGAIPILMGEGTVATYAGLVDARVRIRGNAGPLMDSNRRHMIGAHIHCPDLSAIEVLEPAPRDALKLAVVPIDKLLQWDLAPRLAHRVHVRGKVTLQWPGSSVCIQDATDGICAQTEQSESLRIGELIDIAGFAQPEASAPALTDAVFAPAGSEAPFRQETVKASSEQILQGSYESQLIQTEGELISRDLSSDNTTLLLSSGKYIFKAVLPRALGGPETDSWKTGSILQITGVCSVQLDVRRSGLGIGTAVPTSFVILMRSPADVVVTRKPSWWTPGHAVLLLTCALGMTMVVLAWVVALRKRVEDQADLLRISEQRFRHLAQHDSLTGLATRVVLHDRLIEAYDLCLPNQSGFAVLILDVDKFKNINDTLGHHTGDAVLRTTALRLLETVRASDTVIRLGGDEFLVLLANLPDPQVAEAVAAVIVAALSVPVRCDSQQVPVSVSVGICTCFGGKRYDAEMLLRHADTALYQAKERGRHCFQVFQDDPSAAASEPKPAASVGAPNPPASKYA